MSKARRATTLADECPVSATTLWLARIFTSARRRWARTPPERTWGALCTSLVFADGICHRETLDAALAALAERPMVDESQFAEIDVFVRSIGHRTVVLSQHTLLVAAGLRACPVELAALELEADAARYVSREAAAIWYGAKLDLLLQAAAAYFRLHAPACLASWMVGALPSRATTVESRARIMNPASLAGPSPDSLRALDEAKWTKRPLAKPKDAVADLLSVVREAADQRIDKDTAAYVAVRNDITELISKATDDENACAALLATYARLLLDKNLAFSTVQRYLQPLVPVVIEHARKISFNAGVWALPDDFCAQLRCSLSARGKAAYDPADAAITHLDDLLGQETAIGMARSAASPHALVCWADVECAIAAIEADERAPTALRDAAVGLIAVAALSGLRIDEALCLRWCDVHGDAEAVSVTKQSAGTVKSHAAERFVPIAPLHAAATAVHGKLVASLARLRSQATVGAAYASATATVFVSDDHGRPYDAVADFARSTLALVVGEAVSFHALRHLYVTELVHCSLAAGQDTRLSVIRARQLPEILKARVGHASESTSWSWYVHGIEYAVARWMADDLSGEEFSAKHLAARDGVDRTTVWRRQVKRAGSGRSECLPVSFLGALVAPSALDRIEKVRPYRAATLRRTPSVSDQRRTVLAYVFSRLAGSTHEMAAYEASVLPDTAAFLKSAWAATMRQPLQAADATPFPADSLADVIDYADALCEVLLRWEALAQLRLAWSEISREPSRGWLTLWPRDQTLVKSLSEVLIGKRCAITAAVAAAEEASSERPVANAIATLKACGIDVHHVGRRRGPFKEVQVTLHFHEVDATGAIVSTKRARSKWTVAACAAAVAAMLMRH